jgi:hypothetical protein
VRPPDQHLLTTDKAQNLGGAGQDRADAGHFWWRLMFVLLDEGVRDEAAHARRSSTKCVKGRASSLATFQQLQQKGTTSRHDDGTAEKVSSKCLPAPANTNKKKLVGLLKNL